MPLLVILYFLLLRLTLGSSSSSCLLVEACQTDEALGAERFLNDEVRKARTAQVPVLEMTSLSTEGGLNYQCGEYT